MKKLILIFILLTAGIQNVQATVQFNEPIRIVGQCDQQTISTTISPDASAVSLLMDSNLLLEQLPGVTQAQILNKRCIFKIHLKASPKEKYEIMGFDWRGFVALPGHSSASIQSRVWLTHNIFRKNGHHWTAVDSYTEKKHFYYGPLNKDVFMKQKLREPKRVTECGKDYAIIIEVLMKLKNKDNISNAQMGIDSLDIGQTTSDLIVKKPCDET